MSKHTYKHDEVSAGDVVVDSQGTIWFWDDRRGQFRYLTEDDGTSSLSWDGYAYPSEVYEPYTMLDSAATTVLTGVIDGLLIDEQSVSK